MSQVQDDTRLFRGQGQVFIGKRVGGKPAGLEFVGNCTELALKPKVEKIKHTESQTGKNSTDKVIERTTEVEMMMKTDSMTRQNLARLLFGKATVEPIVTISNEEQLAFAGKMLILDNIHITNFASLTPLNSTTPYVLGTDYKIVDLAQGMIEILVGGAISVNGTAVRANYAKGASEVVSAFSTPNIEYWVRFNGLNTAEEDNPVTVDLFKTRFTPTDDFSLISSDKFAEFNQSGDVLFDAQQPVDGKLGRFFSVRQLFLG